MGQPGSRWDRRCDCTRPKRFGAESCSYCSTLDGKGAVSKIISALRILGGRASLDELVEETGLSRRHIQRLCRRAPGLRKRQERVETYDKWGTEITIWALHQVPA